MLEPKTKSLNAAVPRNATLQSSPMPPRTFQSALQLGIVMALIKLAFHVITNLWQAHLGYGFHRDELYYLVCGRRLAWGYVDQAPLVGIQAWLALHLFGDTLTGVRLLSALAGAGRALLTGLLCWQLGGRRGAQFLAMLCVLMAPQYVGLDSFISMNSFESLFWIGFLMLLLAMQHGRSSRYWLLAGVLAGLGLLNKPSMVFFLVAVLAALLFTPQRRLLWNRFFVLAVGITLLLVLPYLLWQHSHHWPTWEYLRFEKTGGKYVKLSTLDFLQAPIDLLLPITLPVWTGGLFLLLRDKQPHSLRWLGFSFVLFSLLMWRLGAKDYYVAPIYPLLLAAGGLLWERVFAGRIFLRWRIPCLALFTTATVVYGLIVMPMAVPVFSAEGWAKYLRLTGQHTEEHEHVVVSILPQWFADRYGWPELAGQVKSIMDALPAKDRDQIGILCDNYGEASAINFFDRKAQLPFAMSGHNNYFIWGTKGYHGDVLLLVTGQTPQQLHSTYASVQVVGQMHSPLALPSEQKAIYLVRSRVRPLAEDWPSYRWYF